MTENESFDGLKKNIDDLSFKEKRIIASFIYKHILKVIEDYKIGIYIEEYINYKGETFHISELLKASEDDYKNDRE